MPDSKDGLAQNALHTTNIERCARRLIELYTAIDREPQMGVEA